ncbi:MAG: sigma-70 family RNA polymerase sigma factor [Cyanobium sp.]|nr:sigma-70 family RNA polymerase sigma factor [Cyanobium sp.]
MSSFVHHSRQLKGVTCGSAATSRSADRRYLRQRDQRITEYRRLVDPIARHYQRQSAEPLDDLIQVGLLGLLRAAELYRSDTGTPFDAFARPHVRGAILHYLRDQAAPVRLPRRLEEQRQQLARLQRLHPELTQPEQWRRALGLSVDQWNRLLAGTLTRRPLSLEATLEEHLQQTSEPMDEPLSLLETDEAADPLGLLTSLEHGQREVVEKVVLAGWSYRRTGAALKISPMTVQRRLQRGLNRLRQLLSQTVTVHPVASAAPGC